MNQRYEDGSDIHVGDVIAYNGQRGNIVIVIDRDEYAPRFPKSEWALPGKAAGFMIEFMNGARMFLDSPDEHLEVIAHKQ